MADTINPDGAGDDAGDGGLFPISPGSLRLDLDILPSSPVSGITGGSSRIKAGSDGFIHVPLTVTGSGDGAAVDVSGAFVFLAVVRAAPAEEDWLPGDWLTRTVDPAGQYARLAVGPASDLDPLPGYYRVYVRFILAGRVWEQRAPGLMTFE